MHDNRIQGDFAHWLPDTQMFDNNLCTDVHVNNLQHLRVASVHKTVFGVLCPLNSCDPDIHNYEWITAYKKICNITKSPLLSGLDEKCCLEIALKMRANFGVCHTYRDTHIVFKKMCMIVQEKTFKISGDTVIEVERDSSDGKIITVHEIAFHPDRDPATECTVALYFNIPKNEIIQCTAQHMKNRNKWEDKLKKQFSTPDEKNLKNHYVFPVIQTMDRDMYFLIETVLNHRIHFLKMRKLKSRSQASFSSYLKLHEFAMISTFF